VHIIDENSWRGRLPVRSQFGQEIISLVIVLEDAVELDAVELLLQPAYLAADRGMPQGSIFVGRVSPRLAT
jgi:hypothetical protein